MDGTPNEAGHITKALDLVIHYKDHAEWSTFYVTSIGQGAIILGHPWLAEHFPEINWHTGEVKMTCCPESCGLTKHENHLAGAKREDLEWISATSMVSMRLAEVARDPDAPMQLKDVVPGPYQTYQDVFSKESFDELLERRQWDHAIELIPDAQPFSTKVYPMSPVEQKELDSFLEENLRTSQIHPSKSPMASPVFFVDKKDGKLRFIQDYRKLHVVTVKNTYPLPLVLDIINKIAGMKAKYFTKLDVRWGYNKSRKVTNGRQPSRQTVCSSSP